MSFSPEVESSVLCMFGAANGVVGADEPVLTPQNEAVNSRPRSRERILHSTGPTDHVVTQGCFPRSSYIKRHLVSLFQLNITH